MRRILSAALLCGALLSFALPSLAQTTTCALSNTTAVLHLASETGYTLAPNDQCHLLVFQNSGAETVTVLPPNSFFLAGWTVNIVAQGAGAVTLSTSAGGNINGASSLVVNQNQGGTLWNDGTNWWFVSGTGASLVTLTWGSGSTITGRGTGGATAATLTSIGTNGNLLLESASGVGTGVVALGGSSLASAALQIPNVASSVDYFSLTGSAAGNPATIGLASAGTDSNINVLFGSSGTGVVALGGPSAAAASEQVATVTSSVDFLKISGAATANPAYVVAAATGTDTNVGLSVQTKGTGAVFVGSNSNASAGMQIATVASAINQWVLTPTITGADPTLLAGGSGKDATVGAVFGTTGTGDVRLETNSTEVQFHVLRTASAVNNLRATGSTGTAAVVLDAEGTGGTVPIIINPKSTGGLWLGGATTGAASLQVATPAGTIINQWVATPTATGSDPTFLAGGASQDAAGGAVFGTRGTGNLAFDSDATVVQFQVLRTASAVNNLQVTGSTGTAVVPITTAGTGVTIPIGLFPKGTSLVALGGTTVANSSAQVNTVASSVDFASISGSVTGTPALVIYGVGGTDAQVDVSLRGAGTTNKLRLGDSYTNYVTLTGSAAGNPMIAPSGNNLLLGGGAQLLQNATTGFIAIPSNATGKPSGAPTGAGTGAIPMSVDPTPEVCFYIAGAWKCAALS